MAACMPPTHHATMVLPHAWWPLSYHHRWQARGRSHGIMPAPPCPATPPAGGDNSGPERPISVELLELLKAGMTVFWNLALFLAFADVLHRCVCVCAAGGCLIVRS